MEAAQISEAERSDTIQLPVFLNNVSNANASHACNCLSTVMEVLKVILLLLCFLSLVI